MGPHRRPRVRRAAGTGAPLPRAERRGGNTRANQALELVREKPGITIPEIAQAMKIEPNYLYRVLPRLASDGQVKRDGQGWHPAPSSTSTRVEPVRNVPARKQTRAAKRQPDGVRNSGREDSPETASRHRRPTAGPPPVRPRRQSSPRSQAASAMTAGQVATKAGLARPTVSTTLSKLAKTGEVQKAPRGYRLTSAS